MGLDRLRNSWELKIVIILFFMASGCVTSDPRANIYAEAPEYCRQLKKAQDWDDPIRALNNISRFHEKGCYQDVIEQVEIARGKLSHKTHSILKEGLEFLIPEGKLTDYVLESYERGYLSFLAATSYLHTEKIESVTPELNKLYNEESALTYNHGRDPVNALIQGAMWDNFSKPGFSARPFWLWLSKSSDVSPKARAFAKVQISRIDSQAAENKSKALWKIYEVGRFPALDWEMKFLDNEHGYFKIRPKQQFPETCTQNGAILLPTTSWFTKISRRHAYSYHPLVNAKSWVRLPIGVFLGVSTFTVGTSITVGGCVADASAKMSGDLCKLSILGGKAVIDLSPKVVDYALQPDLRHWEELPSAIAILPIDGDSPATNECLRSFSPEFIRRIL